MEIGYYKSIAKGLGPRKFLGQNFLVSESIAEMESKYAEDLNVVELGPGLGILTRELCKTAKSVTAIEKDNRLYDILYTEIKSEKLKLINADFFEVDRKNIGKPDIMVSNIPYNLSSKTIYWLASNNIPALICIQKEFADHMLAKPGSRDYSRLSVVSALRFKAHRVKEVSAGNFYPTPKVDSCLVYLAPRSVKIDDKVFTIISLIMNHKKKRLHNAIADSSEALGITKDEAKKISSKLDDPELRPFHLEPEKILMIAEKISGYLDQKE